MDVSQTRKDYLDFKALVPDVHQAALALGQLAAKAGIDKQLLELVKVRASQINGCAFCLQYHILQGETLGVSTDKFNLARSATIFQARARRAGLDGSADISAQRRQ
jgi:AhpD family alkylhydroperoxidase